MLRLILVTALPLFLASGPLPQKRDGVPIATPAGKPISCLSLSQVRETRVRDDRTIDFYTRGGRVYRNTLPYGCPQLGFEQRFTYQTSLDQICSVDTITVLTQPGLMRGATCGLGEFQPITIEKR